MLVTLLLFGLAGLAVLVSWAMTRLSRAQVLRTVSLFIRRQMPLEASLLQLTEAHIGSKEERLMRRLTLWLDNGADLPHALCATKIVTRQQSVALAVASEHGCAEALLLRLADQATRVEKRLAVSAISYVYPLAVGGFILVNASFVLIFIMPKFAQMMKEIETPAGNLIEICPIAVALAWALLGWGLLAWALQLPLLGERLWWHVPWLGTHFRIGAQASLARNLGLMLGSGATLERAIGDIAEAHAGGSLQARIQRIRTALARGDAPVAAFAAAGRWRPELLWAIESISHGAPPDVCLEEVARVLEDKARAHLIRIHRICAPVAFIVSAAGVALLAIAIFSSIVAIEKQMIP